MRVREVVCANQEANGIDGLQVKGIECKGVRGLKGCFMLQRWVDFIAHSLSMATPYKSSNAADARSGLFLGLCCAGPGRCLSNRQLPQSTVRDMCNLGVQS